MPGRCSQARESATLGLDLRHYIYHSHRIIFRIEEEAGIVRILHVRHAARRAIGETVDGGFSRREPKLMSIEEFVADPDLWGYELIEGFLVERKPMGALSDFVAQQISRRLGNFCEENHAGYVFGSETTYRCFDHPDTGRQCDVSYIRRGRLPGERIPESYIEIPPDLAVEVISPNDLAYKVEAKVSLYMQYGFGEVWLVYPNLQTIHAYRTGEPILRFGANQTIVGRGPLAGFSCAVNRFFPESPQP